MTDSSAVYPHPAPARPYYFGRESTRLLLVNHSALVGNALTRVLESEADLQLMGLARDRASALRLVLLHRPDVVIIDHDMPNFDGVRLIEQIAKTHSTIGLILMASSGPQSDLLPALRLGARGCLMRDSSLDEMLATIRAVGRGEACLPPSVTTKLLSDYRRLHPASDMQNGEASDFGTLTEREMSILALVAAGQNNRDIARKLCLTEGTVKNHVSRILTKLQARNRTELAVRCRNLATI